MLQSGNLLRLLKPVKRVRWLTPLHHQLLVGRPLSCSEIMLADDCCDNEGDGVEIGAVRGSRCGDVQ